MIILADDLGYADASCYGGKIRTPHIDRLAAEGMRFTDAHSTSSVCTPTRYGLLTGRYNWRTKLQRGVLGGLSPRLIEPGRTTLASLLKEQGYHTACIGKWHLGMDWTVKPGADVAELSIESREQVFNVDFEQPIANGPNSVGFDYYYGISASLDMVPYVFIENDRVASLPTEDRDFPMMHDRTPQRRTRKGPTAPGFDAADVLPVIARKSVEYIGQRAAEAREGQPFFLYVPLASPHTPILPTPEWQGRSGMNPYADFVMQSDWAVGEILAALDRHKLTDQTFVVFTSDNGCSPEAKFDELAAQGHHPSGPLRGTQGRPVRRWAAHPAGCPLAWADSRWEPPAINSSARSICWQPSPRSSGIRCRATRARTVSASCPRSAAARSAHATIWSRIRSTAVSPFVAARGSCCSAPTREAGANLNRAASRPPGCHPCSFTTWRMTRPSRPIWLQRHPETVRELTALLEQLVAEGRSTPGPRQPNHGPIDIRANVPK